MFKIYIKDFNNSNGVLVTEETLVQQIPAKNQYDLKLLDPKVKNEMGSSETLSFSIEPGTKFYDAFLQMKTYMRITYEDDTIFYGRVLTISNNTFRGTRQIRMEGPLAFLTDSPVEGVEESKRAKITTYAYMQKLISDHNKYCASEPNKKFMLGNVPGNYSSVTEDQQIKNDTQAFGSDSWTDTKSALEDLRSHYGGYFRTRAAGKIGKGVYLDWMNHYFNSKKISQKIEVGKNVLDISNVTEINNIFTAIIPIGRHSVVSSSNIATSSNTGSTKMENLYLDERVVYVPDIINQYPAGALNSGYHKYEDYRDAIKNYGIIIKPVTFQEADTKEKLRKAAFEWIKNNYQGGVTKFTIKAIDMHQIGDTAVSKIMIGDQVEIKYPVGNEKGTFTTKTITLTCLSIDFDLYHPENNSYTFGIPANMLTKTYGVKKAGSINSGITDPPKATPTIAPDSERPWIAVVRNWLMNHKLHYNGPMPFVEDAEHRSHMYAIKDEDNQIYWPTQDKLYNAYIKNTSGEYAAGSYKNFKSENPPRVFDEDTIDAYHVCEFVKYMYGIDLRTDLEVKAPDITVTQDGWITLWQSIKNGADETIGKAKGIFIRLGELLSTHKLDVLGPDGQEMFSYMDSDGNWHYYYVDPKTGEKVETNIRDLSISAIDSENKVGWIVQEGQNGYEVNPDSFPGQMTLAIENYTHGELVTARLSGELMYLGNYKTQQYTAVSLKHMDQVCGDFEYVKDPDTGVEYVKVKCGGGMRVSHGTIDPETGEFIKDEDGNLIMSEFGIYDEDTLKGGVITNLLDDGTVVTKIKGDIIDIEAKQVKAGNSFDNLERWLNSHGKSIDDVSGLLAEKIIAYEGEFDTIKSDYLLTGSLETEFGKLTNVIFNNGGRVTMGGEWFCSPAFDKITLPAGKVFFTSTAGDHESSTTYSSTPSSFLKDIRLTKVGTYQHKLQYKRHGDSTNADEGWHDIPDSTFSGASLLTGSWSGGIFTVKNDPTNSNAVAVPPGTVSTTALHLELKGNPSASGKNVSQVVKVQWRDLNAEAARPGMGPQYSDTGFEDTVTINASSVYTSGNGDGYRKALSDKGIIVANSITSWPALRLNPDSDGAVTVSGKNVKQKVYVQYRDAIAEAAGQAAPYYTNSSISGTVTIDATKVYDKGSLNGYSEASGKVKVNGYSSVNTSHSIEPGGSCTITVPYYNGSASSPKSTLTHTVTATGSAHNTPHYNAIGDLNFLRPPDGSVQKLSMTYTYRGVTYSAGTHWWFYENDNFGATYSGNLYTYYT